MNGSLMCDHLLINEQKLLRSTFMWYFLLWCATIYGGPNFLVFGWNPCVWPSKWKLLRSPLLWHCLLWCIWLFQPLSLWINPSVWPVKWKLLSSAFTWHCNMLYKVVLTFLSWYNPSVWPFKWKLLRRTFMWYCLLCCTRLFYLSSLWIWTLACTINESCWVLRIPLL